MFIVTELINSLITLTNIVFQILTLLIVVRILLSWFGVDPYASYNELVQILFRITEPMLAPFRRLPLTFGGIDFSPMLVFVVLQFANRVIVHGLLTLAGMMH